MIEDFIPLRLPPGMFANGTKYQAAGRWHEGNFVRFHEKTIRPIGGWQQHALTGDTITGDVQDVLSWSLADGTPFMAVATSAGLWVVDDSDVAYDILPASGDLHAAPYNWQLSIFGAYLVATNSLLGDDDISLVNVYTWTGDTGTPAAPAWTDDIGPKGAYACFVTPERFLVQLRGTDPTTAPARTGVDTAYSGRRLYWPSQEDLTGFVSSDTNTGGNFDLATDGRLMAGAPSRGQSLIWTDVDLWTMTYIGDELIYSFANVGRECGTVSKRAHVVLDKAAFWMGRGKFFGFDGFVKNLPCEVSDAVFGDFNEARAYTVWAVANSRYNEVTWFYPSAGATSPDRYVTYNYEENHWVYGRMTRSAGIPQRFTQDVIDEPKPVYFDGATMFDHETGDERDALAYLASGPVELGAGDRLMRLQGVLPDDLHVGDVELRLYVAMSPDSPESVLGPFALDASTNVRATARQVRVRLDESAASDWRVGTVRLAARPAERRGATSGDVEDTTPASIEIIPASVTLIANQHYTFSAIIRNAAGQVLDVKPQSWSSSDETLLTVNSSGTVTALATTGTVSVTAQFDTLSSAAASVVLDSTAVPASITIESSETIGVDAEVQLTAVVRTADGRLMPDYPIDTWASADDSIATVSSTGLVTGIAEGGPVNVAASITSPALTSNNCAVTCANPVTLHTFLESGSFDVTSDGTIHILVVGHGGDAGSVGTNYNGGAGGEYVRADSVAVSAGQNYAVEIGAHGALTRFGHTQFSDTYKALAGTDAATRGGDSSGFFGGDAAAASDLDHGLSASAGGGGAGAGASGGDATASTSPVSAVAGAGGDGVTVDIWRGTRSICGGGGGGAAGDNTTSAAGGLGAGPTSQSGKGGNNTSGTDGANAYGGGGGGPNGKGGSGAVFIWYEAADGTVATGGVVTTV